MDVAYYKRYEPIFGAWYIDHLIGEGSFGKVFEIVRKEEFGNTFRAALKVISVPNNQSEIKSLMQDNSMSKEDVSNYYYGYVEELVKEFDLMAKLKGNSYVVSYEDHKVIRHEDGIGWDILIRMELLTPLNDYVSHNVITKKDIIRLGIDICKALTLCQKYRIIHRDIKPENIFVSPTGEYKLGDFGVARTIERTSSNLSKQGTDSYMAPEVYKGQHYGTNVDIYSLGLVLYKLLNNSRLPFLPEYPKPIKHSDREKALVRRMQGEVFPPPQNADGRLAEIVLRACAYSPKERYSVPLRMEQDLEAILYSDREQANIYPDGDIAQQYSTRKSYSANNYSRTESIFPSENESFGKDERTVGIFDPQKTVKESKEQCTTTITEHSSGKKNRHLLIPCVLICAVVALAVLSFIGFQQQKSEEYTQSIEQAYSYYSSGQFKDCIEYSNQKLVKYPNDATLMAICASAYFEEGLYQSAAELYSEISKNSDYQMKIDNMRDYSVCLARLGRLDEAAAVFVMLTNQGATAEITDYVLGETYYAKNDYENAAIQFKKVLSETTDEVLTRRSFLSLAETYRDSGDYMEEIEIIHDAQALPLLKSNSVLFEMLGAAYYEKAQESNSEEDYEFAAHAFEETIRLGMQKDYLYVNAYVCYQTAGRYSEAKTVLERMKETFPSSYIPFAYLSILNIVENNSKPENQRNYQEACELYQQAKSLASTNEDQSVLQQLDGLIDQLRTGGWI